MLSAATTTSLGLSALSRGSARARSAAIPPAPRPRHHCLPRGRLPSAASSAASADSSPSGPVASPFSSASVHRQVGASNPPAPAAAADASLPELSVEAVDACLDEVRPYLIADGGDVEVVSAGGRSVALRLRGACSSCSSSDATMRMGLERAIRARFGSDVQVEQVTASGEEGPGAGPARATVEAVDGHLNMLRNAVASLGGRVRVAELKAAVDKEEGQRAVVWYKGPRSIGNGIKAAILERFPGDVVEVEMTDFPPGEE